MTARSSIQYLVWSLSCYLCSFDRSTPTIIVVIQHTAINEDGRAHTISWQHRFNSPAFAPPSRSWTRTNNKTIKTIQFFHFLLPFCTSDVSRARVQFERIYKSRYCGFFLPFFTAAILPRFFSCSLPIGFFVCSLACSFIRHLCLNEKLMKSDMKSELSFALIQRRGKEKAHRRDLTTKRTWRKSKIRHNHSLRWKEICCYQRKIHAIWQQDTLRSWEARRKSKLTVSFAALRCMEEEWGAKRSVEDLQIPLKNLYLNIFLSCCCRVVGDDLKLMKFWLLLFLLRRFVVLTRIYWLENKWMFEGNFKWEGGEWLVWAWRRFFFTISIMAGEQSGMGMRNETARRTHSMDRQIKSRKKWNSLKISAFSSTLFAEYWCVLRESSNGSFSRSSRSVFNFTVPPSSSTLCVGSG